MASCSKTGIFFPTVLHPFQDYFSSYETGQSIGGRKRENPEKNNLAHPQAELGLSHMWPVQALKPTPDTAVKQGFTSYYHLLISSALVVLSCIGCLRVTGVKQPSDSILKMGIFLS